MRHPLPLMVDAPIVEEALRREGPVSAALLTYRLLLNGLKAGLLVLVVGAAASACALLALSAPLTVFNATEADGLVEALGYVVLPINYVVPVVARRYVATVLLPSFVPHLSEALVEVKAGSSLTLVQSRLAEALQGPMSWVATLAVTRALLSCLLNSSIGYLLYRAGAELEIDESKWAGVCFAVTGALTLTCPSPLPFIAYEVKVAAEVFIPITAWLTAETLASRPRGPRATTLGVVLGLVR